EITAVEDTLLGEPHDGVPLGVAASRMRDLDDALAEPHGHARREGDGRPGEAGHGLGRLEQSGKALYLAGPVLRAALTDELERPLACHDVLGAVRRSAEHADRVIVREHDP